MNEELQHFTQNLHERLRQHDLENQGYRIGTGIRDGWQIRFGLIIG